VELISRANYDHLGNDTTDCTTYCITAKPNRT